MQQEGAAGQAPGLTADGSAIKNIGMDIGMGALYFFASHMVIRTTFYLGDGRSEAQMVAFALVVLAAMALAHLAWRPLLDVRLASTEYTGIPLVSLLAALGAALSLISIIPAVGEAYFYLGALFVGLAIGLFSVVLASSIAPGSPAAHHFRVPHALAWAVGFYFAFRAASTVSYTVGEGLLLALPLVTLACSSREPLPADPEARQEGRRSLQVLVWVCAAFAVVGSVVVWVAKGDVPPVESGINYWTLFEVVSVAVILGSCRVLWRLARQKTHPRGTAAFVSCLCVLPPFLAGCATAAAFIPLSNGSLMWESSFWVLIVAIFSYDMRATPYSVDGIAAGIMFEAMCAGQMATQVLGAAGAGLPARALAVLLAALYLVGMFWQLNGRAGMEGRAGQAVDAGLAGQVRRPCGVGYEGRASGAGGAGLANQASQVGHADLEGQAGQTSDASLAGQTARASSADGQVSQGGRADQSPQARSGEALGGLAQSDNLAGTIPGLVARAGVQADSGLAKLSRRYGLTEREEIIFSLVAAGRSASYISDALGISFNTVRTHIRHVYEKLGVHSKQELLDIARGGDIRV